MSDPNTHQPGGRFLGLGLLGLMACGGLLGCEGEATKKCHAEMASSQAVVLAMDPRDRPGVEKALGTIESALAACRAAGRNGEIDELKDAQANLKGHVKLLLQREASKRPPLSAAELAELVKNGDPNCPRGHAYTHGESKKLIACKGPQLFEMNMAQATEHYTRRGFTLTVDPSGKQLRADYGAERVTFKFAEPKSTVRPECLSVMAGPGVTWQELITRATGVPPQKLVEGKALVLGGVELPFWLEGPGADKTVHLGKCPAPATP